MVALSTAELAALGTAVLVTFIEMVDVFALIYALGAGVRSMRPGLLGAAGGVCVVAAIGFAVGAALSLSQKEFSEAVVHGIATIVLWGFGFVLLRSTIKSYIQDAKRRQGVGGSKRSYPPPSTMTPTELTVTGFTVGVTETFEALVPLLAIAAQGMANEAIVGALIGGGSLIPLGYVLHERVKKVKVPQLKWVTTSFVFAFAAQWSFEALVEIGVTPLPSTESAFVLSLFIPPLLVAALLSTRGVIELWVRHEAPEPPPSRDRGSRS